jgi:hypothetical protein
MSADTNDEVDKATQTIADFIYDLGKAVAAGQEALDRSTAEIAEQLSKNMVEIPSVIQETFDDNGMPTDAKITYSKVPMSTIILPMAYEFKRVYFQTHMRLSEIDKTSGIRIASRSASLKYKAEANLDLKTLASGGLSGVNAGVDARASTADKERKTDSSFDSALATLDFNATLGPRRELQVPTPVRLRSAPRIMVALTKFTETAPVVADPAATPPVSAEPGKRTATIEVRVFSATGKDVTKTAPAEVTVDSPQLTIKTEKKDLPDSGLNANVLIITLERTQNASEPLPARTSTVVRVTLGALTEQISVSI